MAHRRARFDDAAGVVSGASPVDKMLLRERVRQGLTFDTGFGDWRRLSDDEARTDAVAAVEYYSADRAWHVRWVLADQSGRFLPRSVTVEATEQTTPEGGVTSNLLRELKPPKAAADLVRALDEDGITDRGVFLTSVARVLIDIGREEVTASSLKPREVRRTGRPPHSDEHIASVAVAYLDEFRRGRGVLRRLGARFDRTPEAMRDQVRIARARGFLTRTKQGRGGGGPGPRLIELQQRKEAGAP